jgi:Flp pilus assembly protein TadD
MAEARGVLESAVKVHGENSQLHYELSRVYARLGERDLAAQETRIVQELRAREAKTQ